MKTLAKYYSPVFLWLGVIFYLSSVPNLAVSTGISDWVLRNGAHGAEYLILMLLVFRALSFSTTWKTSQLLATSLALTFAYALSDEWHQSFVPTRNGNFLDVALDSTGALLGGLLIKNGKVNNLIK